MKKARHLAVEGREAALVIAGLFAVYPRVRDIVGRADVQESANVGLDLVLKILFVPDRALVEEERIELRVPVAGNFQRGRLGKVVLHQLAAGVGLFIQKVAVAPRLHAEVVVPVVVGIHNKVPVAVKADGRAAVGTNEKRRLVAGSREAENSSAVQRTSAESNQAATVQAESFDCPALLPAEGCGRAAENENYCQAQPKRAVQTYSDTVTSCAPAR